VKGLGVILAIVLGIAVAEQVDDNGTPTPPPASVVTVSPVPPGPVATIPPTTAPPLTAVTVIVVNPTATIPVIPTTAPPPSPAVPDATRILEGGGTAPTTPST
jgi:hypothetical protein